MSRLVEDEAEILSVAVAGRPAAAAGSRASCSICICGGWPAFGARTVFLEVDEHNKPAIRLYDRAGFHEISRRPNYYPGAGAKAAAALVLRRDLG